MAYDDNAEPSPSSAEYLESPHEAKRKALKQKLEKQGQKQAANKQGANLKDLKLSLLKGQMDEKKGDKNRAAQNDEKNKLAGFGTKTREQEIASSKLTVDAKPSAEQLVKQGRQDEKAEETLKQDEVQSEDA